MSYSKTYSRINWENEPSVATPINETNLNRMDYSLDAVDTECQTLDTTKANQSDLLLCVKEITYDSTTGQFVFTWQNGSTFLVDLNIEKIPVSFSMDANGVITMTTEDGTTYTADVGSLIKTYSFVDSSQIDFTVTVDAQTGNKSVTAEIKDGSITESKLQPNFLADCKTEVTKAQNAASAAEQSEEDAEAWAVGERGGVPVGPSDPTYHNNSKYWSQQANPTTLVGLTDTDINNPQPNQVLGVDPNDTTKWINMPAPSAGLLPHLYIDSEAGSTVTVVAPDSTIITPTAAGAGHWECDVPSYGVYTIHSVLAGQGDAVVSVTVDDVKEYHITDNHYDFTINVTAPNGSTIRITGGTETYTGTGTGSSQPFVVHTASTVYTVAVTMDGNTKSQTATSSATTGQSTSVSIEFGTITVNVDPDFIAAGSTISCTKGSTACTPKPAASTVTFRVPDTGTWEIAGTIGSDTYTQNAVVSSLATPVTVSLETLPDGKTVTPTDDIQLWLNCAGIFDKTSYTTLDDVLADHETLAKLISDENACDYLVRSKTFIGTGIVPKMTDDTTPSGVVSASSVYSLNNNYLEWMAFNEDETNGWLPLQTQSLPQWIQYEFDSAVVINRVGMRFLHPSNTSYKGTCKIQASNDGFASDIHDLADDLVVPYQPSTNKTLTIFSFANSTKYKYYRVVWKSTTASGMTDGGGLKIQFYPWSKGIVEDETAMRYIGKRNYAADTLLDDADWEVAIVDSDYYESVVKNLVPTMTSATAPSGKVTASSPGYTDCEAYKAFNDYQYGWYIASAAFVNQWIEYEFDTPTVIKGLKAYDVSNSNSEGYSVVTLKGSNVDNDWDNADTLISNYTLKNHPSTANRIKQEGFANNTAYKYYRLICTSNTLTGQNSYGWKVQLHGREDVTEGLNIYSAANDTVTISGGGTTVTCVTDATGHGTIAKSSLPAGTYTFTSSVAKDPDNLSNDYSKQVIVSDGTIEVWMMPNDGVGVLYWYGWKSDNIEDCIASNGWSCTNYTMEAPTWNINSITLTTSANNNVPAFGSKKKVKGNTFNLVYNGITKEGTQYGNTLILNDKQLKWDSATAGVLNNGGWNKFTRTGCDEKYIAVNAGVNRRSDHYAWWIE